MHHARDFGSHLSGEEIKDLWRCKKQKLVPNLPPPPPPLNWFCVLGGRVELECCSALLEKNMLGQKTWSYEGKEAVKDCNWVFIWATADNSHMINCRYKLTQWFEAENRSEWVGMPSPSVNIAGAVANPNCPLPSSPFSCPSPQLCHCAYSSPLNTHLPTICGTGVAVIEFWFLARDFGFFFIAHLKLEKQARIEFVWRFT